jgi:hypothetical protein
VPLAIPLIILLALLVSMGMATVQRSVSGGFIAWAANAMRKVPLFGGFSIDQIVKMDRYITHQLGRAANALTAQSVKWFEDLATYVNVVGYWSLTWPVVIYHEVQKLLHHDIPSAVDARTKPLARRTDAVEAQVKAVSGYAHSFPHKIKAVDRTKEVTQIQTVAMPHAGEWSWIHDHFDTLKKAVAGAAAAATTVALPHAPAFPSPWGVTGKQLRRLWRDRNYLIGATGAAVLVATAIGGVTPRCVRNGNIGRFARRLCGLDSLIADALLADLAIMGGTLSIVEFAKALQKAEPLIASSLAYLVDDIGMVRDDVEAIARRSLAVLESLA